MGRAEMEAALRGALERATDENRVLRRLIEVVYSRLETERVLQATVDLVIEATRADACFVHFYEEERNRLVLRAASDPYKEAVGRVTLELGEGVSGWVALHREPAVIPENKWDDPRYKYIPALGGELYTSMLSVPLVSTGGRLVGVVNVHTERRRVFSESDVSFLSHVASLVAVAIEHAELFRRLGEKEADLQAMVAKTIQAQEEERRRVAAEIHDGVTQQLISIWYRVHACDRLVGNDPDGASDELEAAKTLIDEALAEARVAIYDLRPATLDDLGLGPSLEALVGRTFEHGGEGEDVETDIRTRIEVPVPQHLEIALYRIAQEALANVRKHAGARRVTVELRSDTEGIHMCIEDDGRGFDLEAYRRHRPETAYGLAGIGERVALFGGELRIDTGEERGTRIELSVPPERVEAAGGATT